MTCCGQPMGQEGTKQVCGKCGAWYDPGFAPALLPVGVAV